MVRETVDDILAEQQRAWIRGAIFGGRTGEPSRAPSSTGRIVVGRVGTLLLTTAIGGVIGAVRGDAPTGIVVGLVLGVVLGSPRARRPNQSQGTQSAPAQTTGIDQTSES